MFIAVYTSFYWCSCVHPHMFICTIACVCLSLLMYLCKCNWTSADQTCYLTANTTCCILGCLFPGRGGLRECHIYNRHVADLWAKMFCVVCPSHNSHVCLLGSPYARWIFVLFCVFVKEQGEMGRQFHRSSTVARMSIKGWWSSSLHDSISLQARLMHYSINKQRWES